MRLPNDDTETFELYLHFIYNEFACSSESAYTYQERKSLTELYVLCEKLQDISAKNCVVQALVAIIYKTRENGLWGMPCPEEMDIIYKGTVKGSLARQIYLDVFTYSVKVEYFVRTPLDEYEYPGNFLQELAINLMKKRPPVNTASVHPARKDGVVAYLEKEEPNKTTQSTRTLFKWSAFSVSSKSYSALQSVRGLVRR